MTWQWKHGELGECGFDPDFMEHFAFPFWPSCFSLACLDNVCTTKMSYLYSSFFFLPCPGSLTFHIFESWRSPKLSFWQFVERVCHEWDLEKFFCTFIITWKDFLYIGQEEQGVFNLLTSFHLCSHYLASCGEVSSRLWRKYAEIKLEMSTLGHKSEKAPMQI